MEIPASFHWWRMEERSCEQLTEKKQNRTKKTSYQSIHSLIQSTKMYAHSKMCIQVKRKPMFTQNTLP